MGNVMELSAGMRLKMKKKHPCGCDVFAVLRSGADVRVRCEQCGREMLWERIKCEKAVKKILSAPNESSEVPHD